MKAQTQSGIICDKIGWPLLVDGSEIKTAAIMALKNDNDFEKHIELSKLLGFELFVKRARIGTSKHIRVRPRFKNWSASGTLTVVDQQITKEMLQTILTFAGSYCGIGDWRPSSPTPGQFGRFIAEVKEI
jgi:hypothetical protein